VVSPARGTSTLSASPVRGATVADPPVADMSVTPPR
jgi:hypothetical protein